MKYSEEQEELPFVRGVKHITLERIRHAVCQELDRRELSREIERIRFDFRDTSWCDTIGVALVRELFGQRQNITIEHPADWWEAVKERWLPKWALKRWPVKYQQHNIVANALFPDLAPMRGHRMEFAIFEEKGSFRS